jgi:hypothetical protein
MNERVSQVLQACPTYSHLCGYVGKVTKDTTSQSVIGRIVVGMTAHKGKLTNIEALKVRHQ